METAGVIEELGNLFQSMKVNGKEKGANFESEAKSKVKDILQQPYVKRAVSYYGKVFKKVTEKGDDYLSKELARLERLLKSDTVQPSKVSWSFIFCVHLFR
jgi:CTP-dependent riboflavin kinase